MGSATVMGNRSTVQESNAALLAFATEVAQRAGKVTLDHFRRGVAVEWKRDGSPVTAADREAEACCRELIQRRFPDDGILGEEFGEKGAGAARRWILDPIDGTRSFVRGVPLYGVLVAVEIAGRATVGVAHFPALGETVAAALGEGCWRDGVRCRVSAVAELGQSLILTTDTELLDGRGCGAGWRRLTGAAQIARTWGDCYGHALVATGRAEAMIDAALAPWDAAALLPIITEAGGAYGDWQGRRDHLGGSGISTNAILDGAVRALLGAGAGGGQSAPVAE